MSLVLPQKIMVEWNPLNKKHYESLGYTFTNYNDSIEVNIGDIQKGSEKVLVKVKCDFCDKIVEMSNKRYVLLRSEKYCCQECIKFMKRQKDKNGNNVWIKIPYRDKKWLENEYINKDRDAQDIADECGINMRTLREWINKFGLTIKSDKTSHITKEEIEELYLNQRKTTIEIGKIYGVCDVTISNLLKKFGIPSFSTSETTNYYLYNKGGLEKARKTQSTMENRIKSSCRQHGISIEDFKGFSTTEQHMQRNNTYYKEWKNNVFKRDDWTCQACGKRGGNLNAHHLYNFSEYEDLRYDVDNGITFCEHCHLINYPNSFHSIYGEKNNTPEQVYEFIDMKKNEAV